MKKVLMSLTTVALFATLSFAQVPAAPAKAAAPAPAAKVEAKVAAPAKAVKAEAKKMEAKVTPPKRKFSVDPLPVSAAMFSTGNKANKNCRPPGIHGAKLPTIKLRVPRKYKAV